MMTIRLSLSVMCADARSPQLLFFLFGTLLLRSRGSKLLLRSRGSKLLLLLLLLAAAAAAAASAVSKTKYLQSKRRRRRRRRRRRWLPSRACLLVDVCPPAPFDII
jgi:hypothetical protein